MFHYPRAMWRWVGCPARFVTLVTSLQRNGLIGQLPDELGRLTKLQILRLGFNKLAGLPAAACLVWHEQHPIYGLAVQFFDWYSANGGLLRCPHVRSAVTRISHSGMQGYIRGCCNFNTCFTHSLALKYQVQQLSVCHPSPEHVIVAETSRTCRVGIP